jgi:hypothetical protein
LPNKTSQGDFYRNVKEVTMFRNQKRKQFGMPLFVVLVLVLATLACGGEVSPTKVGEVPSPVPTKEEPVAEPTATKAPEEAPAPTDTPAPQALTTYQVGDIISIGDMVMVVLGWDSPPGDDFSKPDEGKKFVAVDVLLVNQGSASTSVSTMLQMSLKDATAQKYDVDLTANIATGSSAPDGEISPGERVRGKVGFQVPQDAEGLVFVFDASIFGTGKVFVELGPEPIAIEPPAQLAGEQEQTTFVVGDIVEIGDLTLIVNEVTSPPGDEFNKPNADNKFVVVDVTLENKGAEAKNISSMMQMHLKDATGQRYDLDLSASMASGGTTPDGEIAPGEKMRGQVGFQVPENAQGLVFVFDADVFGYGKVFVTLP